MLIDAAPLSLLQELARAAQACLSLAAEVVLGALGSEQAPPLLQQVSQSWAACAASANLGAAAAAVEHPAGAAVASAEAQHAQQLAAVQALQGALAQVQQMLSSLRQCAGGSGEAQRRVAQLGGLAAAAAGTAVELAASLAAGADSTAGKFEWVDGALTR